MMCQTNSGCSESFIANNKFPSEVFHVRISTSNPVYKPFRYPWAYDAWKKQQQDSLAAG